VWLNKLATEIGIRVFSLDAEDFYPNRRFQAGGNWNDHLSLSAIERCPRVSSVDVHLVELVTPGRTPFDQCGSRDLDVPAVRPNASGPCKRPNRIYAVADE
jgi:hypothetical protein